MVEVLEHVPDEALPAFTGHVDRVLAPGGTLILTAPSPLIGGFRALGFEVLERHYLTRRSALYHVLSFLLCRLDVGPASLRRLLLAAFDPGSTRGTGSRFDPASFESPEVEGLESAVPAAGTWQSVELEPITGAFSDLKVIGEMTVVEVLVTIRLASRCSCLLRNAAAANTRTWGC